MSVAPRRLGKRVGWLGGGLVLCGAAWAAGTMGASSWFRGYLAEFATTASAHGVRVTWHDAHVDWRGRAVVVDLELAGAAPPPFDRHQSWRCQRVVVEPDFGGLVRGQRRVAQLSLSCAGNRIHASWQKGDSPQPVHPPRSREPPAHRLTSWLQRVDRIVLAPVALHGRFTAHVGAHDVVADTTLTVHGVVDLTAPGSTLTVATDRAQGQLHLRHPGRAVQGVDYASGDPEVAAVELQTPLGPATLAVAACQWAGKHLRADGVAFVLRAARSACTVSVAHVSIARSVGLDVSIRGLEASECGALAGAAVPVARTPAALVWAATTRRASIGVMELHTGTGGVRVATRAARLSGRWGELAVRELDVDAPSAASLVRPAEWTRLDVTGPALSVPHASPLLVEMPALARAFRSLSELRAPRDATPTTDDESDGAPPPPQPPPLDPGGTRSRRPAYAWMAALARSHARLFEVHGDLERTWPERWLPQHMTVQVRAGRLARLDAAGRPDAGVADVALAVEPGVRTGQAALKVGIAPFDARGPWGTLGVHWRRKPSTAGHEVELRATGAGFAQSVAARIPGMTLGDAADVSISARLMVPASDRVSVEGHIFANRMGIRWWRLADRAIDDFGLDTTFHAVADKGRATWTVLAPEIRLFTPQSPAGARLHAVLDVTRIATQPRIHARVALPMQDCGTLLHAVPGSLTPTLGRIDAHGQLGGHAAVTVTLPHTGAVDVDLALADTPCVVDRLGAIDLRVLAGDFSQPVNENGKDLPDVPWGPASGSWTPLVAIPNWVSYGMWATEDPFLRHRGLSEDLIEKALGIDLTTGRFTYGGSTITQQLVKTVFLRRTKALARKFEEMLIVWQVERQLGKRRILELYCNGVEFGPKVYGITRAAWAFYQKTPAQLTPEEGLYLAIIKPSPRSGHGTMRSNGWGAWYESKMRKYMEKFLDEGIITRAQFDRAAARAFQPEFRPPR